MRVCIFQDSGFRVYPRSAEDIHEDAVTCLGLGLRVQGLGFGVQGLGFRFGVEGLGFRVQGSGFRVQGADASGAAPLFCGLG